MKTTIDDQISPLQELRILLCLIRHADAKGSVDFNNPDVTATLSSLVRNWNAADYLLYKLDEAGVIDYSEIGEDGFKPIILCFVNDDTHQYVAGLAEKTESDYVDLDKRITDILTFNPSALTNRITDTKRQIEDVKKLVASNDLLKPMAGPLREIQSHFDSISIVSEGYEHIYKNIIRPVQDEGKSGVRATVRWAIFSILISTAISLAISNWSFLKDGLGTYFSA
ncbi:MULTISPECIES: hypothetical protein [Pseudomonas]|uniref:Uncharacterized protein n=1 Tax=Pseudomonas psychrophila TaxID=122355 RepID=A0ABY0W4G9_9PSED|nr:MULTISPECIES: hypothetical protein [Pseudomonas]KAB0490874.1 hypothetical protein F7Q95_10160 [Pseudomonas psychrophila]KMM99986.1 hypothetical protein TU76_12410 [Pseudomonas psychrophila]MCH4883138.1 hypothetical protein [Pseudomonas sp. TMW22080]QIE34513.1 hypothetical protein G5J76_20545 [Pseudomonas psychrophila]WVI96613.1 hypothetical protein VR624_17720 [Pseudomonas psychrophila]